MEAWNRNRHFWLMLLCCLIPLAALGAVLLLGLSASSVLVLALILLCPLSHLLLMGRAGHSHGHGPGELVPEASPQQPVGPSAEQGRDGEVSG